MRRFPVGTRVCLKQHDIHGVVVQGPSEDSATYIRFERPHGFIPWSGDPTGLTAGFEEAAQFVAYGANFSDFELCAHAQALDLGTDEEIASWDRATLIAKLQGSEFDEHAYL